jgi:hypothetical protein
MRSVGCAITIILALVAVAGAVPPEVPVPAIPGPPPLPTGPAPDLDLVFTSQVIGYIEPCG